VIAFRAGSVPEVIEDGVTGFIVKSEEEAVRAVSLVGKLKRRKIRQIFQQRFTARRMANDYVDIYRQMADDPILATEIPDAVAGKTSQIESPISVFDPINNPPTEILIPGESE
jgi:hypothetical protein